MNSDGPLAPVVAAAGAIGSLASGAASLFSAFNKPDQPKPAAAKVEGKETDRRRAAGAASLSSQIIAGKSRTPLGQPGGQT